MSGWVWKFSRLLFISFPASFVKIILLKKWIPGLALVGVPPLGQGGRPPDVRVGLEILQITTYIISSKSCICGPILSHNVTPWAFEAIIFIAMI